MPCFNAPRERLDGFYRSLLGQTLQDFEVIVVDDGSCDGDLALPPDPRFQLVRNARQTGPAGARNAGAARARAEVLFFTDSDCELAPGTLECVVAHRTEAPLLAGNTVTRSRTFFGTAVAFLGFPGGGSLGFDRVWPVDATGHTDSVSGCNFAIRRAVFEEIGGFDPTFPVAGGEDTVLGKTALSRGHRIKYIASQLVYHPGRESLRSFVRWQITRGRGCFHIARRLDRLGRFLRLRLWSLRNSLRAAGLLYGPLVLVLWSLLVVLQGLGYGLERARWVER